MPHSGTLPSVSALDPHTPLPETLVALARQVAESIPMPVMLLDSSHRVMHTNMALLARSDLDPAEIIPRLFPSHHDNRSDGGANPADHHSASGIKESTFLDHVWRIRPLRDQNERVCMILVFGVPLHMPFLPAPYESFPETIAAAIPLKGRRLEIFELLREGRSVKEIAHTLGLGEATVRTHIFRMRKATGCGDLLGLRFAHPDGNQKNA